MPWLPDDFDHPRRLDLPTGDHLRPIRAADVHRSPRYGLMERA